MNCEFIETEINKLKVDSLGRIRNKSKVIDAIHAKHVKETDALLMKIRIYIGGMSTQQLTTDALTKVDRFIHDLNI